MEREIIGYSLKEDCKQYLPALSKISFPFGSGSTSIIKDCIYHHDFEAANVLDLWFEPIYKEETFKKGEWVVITDFGKADSRNESFSLDKAYELREDLTEKNGFRSYKDNNGIINGWSNAFDIGMKFRKATNIEIAKAKYPKGTKFKSARSGVLGISDGEFHYTHENNIYTNDKYVYFLGKWTEIMKEPEVKTESNIKLLFVNGVNYDPNDFITASKLLEYFTPEQINLLAKM